MSGQHASLRSLLSSSLGASLTYLESTSLESSLEVVRLASEDDFVQVEMVRATEQSAVGQFFGGTESDIKISFNRDGSVLLSLTRRSPS